MTWNTFTKAIEESGIENGNQAQILVKLFKRAGCINKKEENITESAANTWIKRIRNCKEFSYFPDKEMVKTQEVYNFFRRRPENKLKKLQEIFCEKRSDDSPVDCETKDMDVFCFSLVNQFLDLLKLEREDFSSFFHKENDSFDREHKEAETIKHIFNDKKKKTKSHDAEQSEHLLDIFDKSFRGFGVQDFLEVDPIESIEHFRIEDTYQFIGRIKVNQENRSEMRLDTDAEAYENISRFIEILWEYVAYLENNMRESTENNQWRYYIRDVSMEKEFRGKTDRYRQQLKSLYNTIDVEIEKRFNKHKEELRALQREAWEKNTQTTHITDRS